MHSSRSLKNGHWDIHNRGLFYGNENKLTQVLPFIGYKKLNVAQEKCEMKITLQNKREHISVTFTHFNRMEPFFHFLIFQCLNKNPSSVVDSKISENSPVRKLYNRSLCF